MWFPVRIHSHYSLLQSTLKPKQIAGICRELGYTSAGLTDFASVSGAVKFVQACEDDGIKPVLGCEIPLISSNNATITLLCKNKEGWTKLLEIVSTCNNPENFKKHPAIHIKELFNIIDNNFVCIDGYVGSALFNEMIEDDRCIYTCSEYDVAGQCLKRKYIEAAIVHIAKFREKFGDDYYLEINQIDSDSFVASKLISNCIIQISKNIGFKNIIGGTHICYGKIEDAKDHRVLLCSKMKTTLNKVNKDLEKDTNFKYVRYFRSNQYYIPEKDRTHIYKGEYIDKLHEINKKCDNYTILSPPLIPQVATNNTQIEELKELCRIGWSKILKPSGKVDKPEDLTVYRDRVLKELEVIEDADLAGYFLIVADYVNEFRKRGVLVGPGRGCFLPDTRVKMGDGTFAPISMIDTGDKVIDSNGDINEVYNKFEYDVDEEIIELEFENNKIIRCTKDHKFLTKNRGWVEAQDLTDDDDVVEV